MHMVEAMYAPSDALTLMLMLPYRRQSMDHRTRMGESFTTQSQGVGDVTIGAHYTVLGDVRRTTHRLLLDGRLGLPTGSIHAHRRVDGGAEEQQLPYPMQLGSGTIHFGPGLTYLGESRRFAWMVQSASAIELGRNSHEYRLGDRLRLSAWAAWAPIGWLSPSLRMDGEMWGNIDGADPGLNPMMVPTADASKRAGTTLSLAPALGFYVPRGPFEGQRIAIEASVPLHQSLDGPQLERDWTLTVVWSWTF